MAVDDYVRRKLVNDRRDTMGELPETENSKPLYRWKCDGTLNESARKVGIAGCGKREFCKMGRARLGCGLTTRIRTR